MKPLLVADLFCGAGGSSTGAMRAVKALGREMILVCVNHCPLAIETHQANHPNARHYIEDITKAEPGKLVPEGYLDLLMASPECTHFSRARGGKPVNNQSRMAPSSIINWLEKLEVRCLLVENVPEFQTWGPLDADEQPVKAMKGIYFERWIKEIKSLGYKVDFTILNAADYGDATTRKRFFLIARKDGCRVTFPKPTHSKDGARGLKKWRAAREIIDWTLPGRSIFDDSKYIKRPLSINTRRRIAAGLKKQNSVLAPCFIRAMDLEAETGGTAWPEAFTLQQRAHATPRTMGEPLHTVTASWNGGNHLVDPKVEPVILGQQSCSAARTPDKPIPTVATGGAISLTRPELVVFHGTSKTADIDKPIPCQPTKSKLGLSQPQIVKYYGNDKEALSVEDPLDTVTTKDRFGLAETIAESFIVDRNHPDDSGRTRSSKLPMNTLTTHHTRPTLISTDVKSADTNRDIDPRRLVWIDGVLYKLDILFRMLTNPELAASHSFNDSERKYEFKGTVAEVTKQIGNSVPCGIAAALVGEILR